MDDADNGIGRVGVVAQQLLHDAVGGGGGHGRFFQESAALSVGGVVGCPGVGDHGQGVEPVPVVFRLDGDAQVDQFFGGFGVAHGDQNPFVEGVLARIGVRLVGLEQSDVPGPALGHERRDGAGDQDHQNRTVQHALVQQADRFAGLGMAGDDVVADHHGSQCGGGLGIAQTEDQTALVDAVFKGFLRGVGGQEFGYGGHDGHDEGDLDGLEVLEEGAVVDQHPHADQEKGDKDSVAHELDAVHQGRGAGDEAVHR